MRERNGRTLPFVFKGEDDSLPTIRKRVQPGSTIYADEGPAWDGLHAAYNMKRVNHSVSFVDEDACTNQAESYFSRLRRAEIGTHHHISGKYLASYAREMEWREDHRRSCNGGQFLMAVAASMASPISQDWKGYWQRNNI